MSDSILIIDFGSQLTQLIARRLREAGREHLQGHEEVAERQEVDHAGGLVWVRVVEGVKDVPEDNKLSWLVRTAADRGEEACCHQCAVLKGREREDGRKRHGLQLLDLLRRRRVLLTSLLVEGRSLHLNHYVLVALRYRHHRLVRRWHKEPSPLCCLLLNTLPVTTQVGVPSE